MKVPSVVQEHPNTSAALGTTPVGILVAWLIGNVLHVSISAEESSAITGGLIAVVLLVGKYGLVGIWHRILHGDGTA